MNGKKISIYVVMVMMFNLVFMGMAGAESAIKDVASTNYAYSSIVRLMGQGIMTIDSKGNFYPTQEVNRFYASKIIAKVMGYDKVVLDSAKEGTKTEINITTKYKGLTDLYQKKFKDWDTTANMQISFLLEKGILKEADLAKFVVEYKEGNQVIRGITKQDMADWSVRVLAKEDAASKFVKKTKFADDASIDEKSKQNVYYLNSIGVFKGDDKNNFNSKSTLKKDSFAIVLSRLIDIKTKGSITPTAPVVAPTQPVVTKPTTPVVITPITPVVTQPITPAVASKKIKLYSGEIETVFDNNSAIKLKQSGDASKIVTLSKNVEVINQKLKTSMVDVKKTTVVICVENDSNIIKLYVTTLNGLSITYESVKQDLEKQTYEIIEDTVAKNTDVPTTITVVKGKITQIVIGETNKITISLDNGQNNEYKLISNCDIVLGNVKSTIYDLRLGQTVNVTNNGIETSKIGYEIQTKQVSINAKIDYANTTENYIRVINTSDNSIVDKIYVDKNTSIYDAVKGEITTSTKLIKDKKIFLVIEEQVGVKKTAKSITINKD